MPPSPRTLVAKVSVVIPTYNRRDTLGEAIDSVLHQTYTDFEIIVVDHGSTDGSYEWVSKTYGNSLCVIRVDFCPLPACPRNHGIKAAQGEYVAFLDSDDLWLPQKLDRQIKALETRPELGWSYGKAERFGPGIQEGTPEIGWWQLRSGHILPDLLMNSFIPCCTVVVRKSCFPIVGLFDETPALRTAEDYELWIRLAAHFPVHAVRQTIARYRVTDDNLSKDLSKRFAIEKLALERASEKLQLAPATRQQAIAGLHLRMFRYLVHTDPAQARAHLDEAWKRHRTRPRILLYQILVSLTGMDGMRRWIQGERRLKQLLG